MRQFLIPIASLSLILVFSDTQALAKDKPKLDDLKSPLSSLYDCSEITDDGARLACFDKVASSLKIAEEKKEIVAIDAQSAKKLKKEAFGFNLPSLPKLGLPSFGGDKDKPEALVAAVKDVRKGGAGYIFILENGQIWQQSNGSFNYMPKGDLTATIKPASMGSFKISVNNGKTTVRGMRVRRVE
ncbi:MAG: hypothetical protein EX271_07600 [Acidimicrobiales bacterium]|nr:hypothetical protein [Hyphomonadaceae bacterium]RZV41641.1 MAG: hypothetical protein EX271_07600 [Acidimicrobiales bacterium]